MASLVRIHFENYPSFGSQWGIWCKLCLKEDRGENLLGLKVCLRSTDKAENRNRSVVQKQSALWKSPLDSGMVDSDWYGLCFNLAQFILHSSWHILQSMWSAVCACACFSRHVLLHSTCLYDTRVLCGVYVWRHRESFQERLSSFFVILLTCHFVHIITFIVDSKSRVKRETNKMEACKTSPQVLFTSCTCADKCTGRLFFIAFSNMLFILTFRVLFATCFVSKRFCVSCEP